MTAFVVAIAWAPGCGSGGKRDTRNTTHSVRIAKHQPGEGTRPNEDLSRLDRLVRITMENTAAHYGLDVAFKYSADAAEPSARCGTAVQGELNGWVDLNRATMANMWRAYGDSGVVGVIVHEMSHIVTCALVQSGKLHQRDYELLADCLTGDYMATYYPDHDMSHQLTMWSHLGDYEFRAWGHHGTPDQRQNAFLEGFRNRLQGRARDPVRATALCLTPIGYTF